MQSRTHSITQLSTTATTSVGSQADFPLPAGDGRGVLITDVRKGVGAFSSLSPSGPLAPDDASEPLLAYQQRHAARLLDVSLATMKRLIAEGRIACVKVPPKLVLVPRKALIEFMSEAKPVKPAKRAGGVA